MENKINAFENAMKEMMDQDVFEKLWERNKKTMEEFYDMQKRLFNTEKTKQRDYVKKNVIKAFENARMEKEVDELMEDTKKTLADILPKIDVENIIGILKSDGPKVTETDDDECCRMTNTEAEKKLDALLFGDEEETNNGCEEFGDPDKHCIEALAGDGDVILNLNYYIALFTMAKADLNDTETMTDRAIAWLDYLPSVSAFQEALSSITDFCDVAAAYTAMNEFYKQLAIVVTWEMTEHSKVGYIEVIKSTDTPWKLYGYLKTVDERLAHAWYRNQLEKYLV